MSGMERHVGVQTSRLFCCIDALPFLRWGSLVGLLARGVVNSAPLFYYLSSMKKISTLFKKNPENLGRVINEPNSENDWVFKGEGTTTIKLDGTAAAIINGELYKRYDVKKGKQVPANAIPCQEPDEITGHWPHWVKCDPAKPEDKYFFEGYENSKQVEYIKDHDFTYELCGPKIQGNPEGLEKHLLLPHGLYEIALPEISFEAIRAYFEDDKSIEGFVFHHPDGRMCKIRLSDFGIKRQKNYSLINL
jgi:hypothetical protein